MAKNPTRRSVEGEASSTQPNREYKDECLYEVKLAGVVEYPPGSGHYLPPNAYVELSGKALKLLDAGRIAESRELSDEEPPQFLETERTKATDLTNAKLPSRDKARRPARL